MLSVGPFGEERASFAERCVHCFVSYIHTSMEPRLLKTFIIVLLIYSASAKRYGGGGSRGGSRSSSSSSHYKPSHSVSRPSSTSYNSGKSSSTSFLHHESGRPSKPASYTPPRSTYTPSAPVMHSTNTHNSNFGKPSGVVNERHQQSNAGVLHNNAYDKQPAYNPHFNGQSNHGTGGSSLPYPVNQPNHPHPSNIGSSSFPSSGAYHPPASGGYHPSTSGGYHPPSSGGYHPPTSGGYHPPMNGGYHPPATSGYQPPLNSGYHPPMNGGYHPPTSGGYHPQMSGGYHPPMNGGYNAPVSSGYHPPSYSPPSHPYTPPHTVYVIPDSRGKYSSGPGLGTHIASGVAGGVAAGATNAIVSHAISSIFRPNNYGVHTYPSAPSQSYYPSPSSGSGTVITNNYYYNGGDSPSNSGQSEPAQTNSYNNGPSNAGQQPDQTNSYNNGAHNGGQSGQSNSYNNGSPISGQPGQTNQGSQYVPSTNNNQGGTNGAPIGGGSVVRPNNGMINRAPQQLAKPDESNFISDEEIMGLTEMLFDNLNTNINQYVELNLQKRVSVINEGTIPDEASEPLFIIKSGLDSIPTVSKLKSLYDQYQRNSSAKEIVSPERQSKENAFLDEILTTPVMKKSLAWLSEKQYVKPNDYDQKEHLKNIWFTVFGNTSSSFERTFLSENFGEGGIAGMQNWIYFAYLEGKNLVDYMGYVDILSLSGRGALMRLNFKTEGTPMQNVPIFIGTPPELELALYTICMHVRYNGFCPVSLGGAKFFVMTQGRKENNNTYVLESGFPTF